MPRWANNVAATWTSPTPPHPPPHLLTPGQTFTTNTVWRHPCQCDQTLEQQSINITINQKFDPTQVDGLTRNTRKYILRTTNCAHTSLTDDTSAGLKCSATVRVCSTLAASRRLFLAGSDFSSALACWYVSLPSANYSKNNNKLNSHLKLKTWWCVFIIREVNSDMHMPVYVNRTNTGENQMPRAGFEPTTPRSHGRCSNHWATEATTVWWVGDVC